MKSFAILLLMIGVIFITIGISKEKSVCPPSRVEYRFVPRTFYEEQTARIPTVNAQFKDMFQDPSVWQTTVGNGSG